MKFGAPLKKILLVSLAWAALGTSGLARAADGWIGPISDEYYRNFNSCGSTRAVGGMQCMGRYCDNVYLFCKDLPAGVTLDLARRFRTSWFSEENTYWRDCGSNAVITGLGCAKSYCDNMQLECTPLATGRRTGSVWGQSFFSEENPAQYFSGRFAFKLYAKGKYSDNLSADTQAVQP